MKIYIFKSALFLLLLSCFSCNRDNAISKDEKELNLENINLGGSIKINMTSTFDLNQYDLDQLLTCIVKELYEIDLDEEVSNNSDIVLNSVDPVAKFVAVDLIISGDLLILEPISGIEPILTLGDDEDCGGKTGDGWTSYGKCLDLRVKRNLLSARVCARVVDC
jgi:hypothetical protein